MSEIQKIAVVHHCNYGIETMTRKGYYFNVYDDNISAGDFVVTENFLPSSTSRSLAIGYVSKIMYEETSMATMKVISRIVTSGQVFKKPVFEDEYGKE